MNKRHVRLVKKENRQSRKSAIYAIVENSKLSSKNERVTNTIRYLLSIGVPCVKVIYSIGYDREGLGYTHPRDVITSETSNEELQEILNRANENECSITTRLIVGDEKFGVALYGNGEFRCSTRSYYYNHQDEKIYNTSETVWNLEDYFNSFEDA